METKEQQLVFVFEQGLLRLPVKYIIRFGCVSKYWYSKIFNFEFGHTYLKFQANNNNNNKLLSIMLPGGTHGSFQSISYDYTNYRISRPTPTHLNNRVLNHHSQLLLGDFIENHEFRIVGSCDGLILVAVTIPDVHGAPAIYIWNPSTREYKMLPKLVPTPGSLPSKVFGFGRDPTTYNNYKVVFLEQIYSIQGDSRSERVFKVHLYTTLTNSWQTLPIILPFYISIFNTSLSMKLAYDHLHFISEVEIDDSDPCFGDAIVSFDLKADNYRVLPRPNFDDQFPNLDGISGLNGGNGGLVALTSLGNCKYVYMMENFCKEDELWTKKYCLNKHAVIDNPSLRYVSVLDISQDGQILLTTYSTVGANPCIVSYNTNTNRAKILYQHVSSSWTMPAVYVESFISPNSTDVQVDEGQQGIFKRRRTSCFQRWTQQAFFSTSY